MLSGQTAYEQQPQLASTWARPMRDCLQIMELKIRLCCSLRPITIETMTLPLVITGL